MSWFKVDDNLAFHPKVLQAGNAPMGLWVRSGSWCAQQLTDGWVPVDIARSIGSRREIGALVSTGLWVPEGASGYRFHQWTDRNPTREQVEARREAGAKRLRKWREERGE